MCGIAGWYRRDGRPVPESVLAAQCATIVRRGPDDQGLWTDGDFGFGMRRLAVVDIAGGHQPMFSRDGRHGIVFNGEVYNTEEIARELRHAGVELRSRSDTEAVLEAFAAWGPAAWPRLEGMYAVAIWDRHTRQLHLARDPLGIKPLYWTLQQGAFAFASELKALAPVPGLRFEPDPEAIAQYVSFGAVLGERAIYRQMYKLPAGCTLTVGPDGQPERQRFWQLRQQPVDGVSPVDWIADCRRRLLQTVERHLVADVPLGAFLSGGVDSSAVVAAMSRLRCAPVRTFTIGFDVPGFDESVPAARAAQHLGCLHTVRRIDPADAIVAMDELAGVYDEPFADDSALATWWVSRLAREQVTVALSGDGGDELFAGYRRHLGELKLQRLLRLPGARLALQAMAHLPELPGALDGPRLAQWRKLAHAGALRRPAVRALVKQYRAPESVLQQVLPAKGSAARDWQRWADELLPGTPEDDPLRALLHVDTTVWLPDGMLVKVDRASMAQSLEVRVPLLAHPFVDWAGSVPLAMKLHNGVGKWVLREAVRDWLPAGLLDRPKQGFALPVSHWMRGDFGDHALALWSDSGAESGGAFRPGAMQALLAEHRSGRRDHGAMLYTLLMFAQWWTRRIPINGSASAP